MQDTLSSNIARNIKELRNSRNLTQEQISRLSGIPRPTWANLESGMANPTVSVLTRVAEVLQVPVEELIGAPRASAKLYKSHEIAVREKSGVKIRRLLPDVIQSIDLERMELPPGAKMTGVPHRAGTREYLTCETGKIELTVAGEKYVLDPGDVVVFRGDQRHSYSNNGSRVAVGYSTVLLKPHSSL